MAWEPPLGHSFDIDEPEQARGAFVFFSYAHQDKRFRDRLENHLSNLKYRGLITTWHDREIRAGEEWMQQIDICLDKANIILLLISADFMASEYCYGIEMKRALERHERKEADVIPILLRSVHFTGAPFAKLQMLPTNGKPITQWRDRDSAFFDVACGIERVTQKYPDGQQTTRRERWDPLLTTPALIRIRLYDLLIDIVDVAVHKVIGAIRARSKAARKRRYYEEAKEAYERALLRNPSDGDAYRGMGNALYALGYYDQALNAFTQAIHLGLSPAAYAGLGDVYARLERYSEAVAAYERAIALDPTVTLNYDDFMRSLRALGRKEEVDQVHARVKQLGYEDEE